MRLIDFNLSTADLDRQLPLYWEHEHDRFPIQSLTLTNQQLVLTQTKTGKPMTLDQFSARTRQLSGPTGLFVLTTDGLVPLFGYRLSDQQLLFG